MKNQLFIFLTAKNCRHTSAHNLKYQWVSPTDQKNPLLWTMSKAVIKVRVSACQMWPKIFRHDCRGHARHLNMLQTWFCRHRPLAFGRISVCREEEDSAQYKRSGCLGVVIFSSVCLHAAETQNAQPSINLNTSTATVYMDSCHIIYRRLVKRVEISWF